MPRGNNYTNKHYFIIDEGWTAESINEKMEEMGLRVHRDQNPLRTGALDRYDTRPGFNLMLYTHINNDAPDEVRRAFTNALDSEWYISRGWEPITAGKMELPY